jgi:hypothetical protein
VIGHDHTNSIGRGRRDDLPLGCGPPQAGRWPNTRGADIIAEYLVIEGTYILGYAGWGHRPSDGSTSKPMHPPHLAADRAVGGLHGGRLFSPDGAAPAVYASPARAQ